MIKEKKFFKLIVNEFLLDKFCNHFCSRHKNVDTENHENPNLRQIFSQTLFVEHGEHCVYTKIVGLSGSICVSVSGEKSPENLEDEFHVGTI